MQAVVLHDELAVMDDAEKEIDAIFAWLVRAYESRPKPSETYLLNVPETPVAPAAMKQLLSNYLKSDVGDYREKINAVQDALTEFYHPHGLTKKAT